MSYLPDCDVVGPVHSDDMVDQPTLEQYIVE